MFNWLINNSDFCVINLSCVFQRLNNSDYCGKNPSCLIMEKLTIRILLKKSELCTLDIAQLGFLRSKSELCNWKINNSDFCRKKNPFFTWKDLTTHILWQTLRWKLSYMGHGNTVDRWLESSDHFEARTLTGSGLFALLKQRVHVMWIFATWSWCMWSHKSTPLFLWTQ